jgi:hypothetical protein
MRPISDFSDWNSASSLVRCAPIEAELEAEASSFIRSRMLETVFTAPSAICSIEVPWAALRDACWSERLSARSLFAIARPAASSPERLIRKPLDSCAIDLFRFIEVFDRLKLA